MGDWLQMGIRQVKLHTIFIQYVLSICIAIIFNIFLCFGMFQLLINFGVILPADHTQTLIRESRGSIAEAPQITKEFIPYGCEYAVFNKNGDFISGSISKENAIQMLQQVKNESDIGGVKHYELIEGKNETCILQYYLVPQFTSQFLRTYLLNPQGSLIIVCAIMMILEIILLSIFFARRINKRLISLKNATQKIRERDLEFLVEYSGIKEIDDVILSLNNMKDELKNSLKEQWNLEQTRKEQIASLAHDIKTPLTIIKGNSELLIESELNNEEKEYAKFITKNAKQIEDYIRILIEISNTEKALSVQISNVDSHEFVANIQNQLNAIANVKKLKVDFLVEALPPKLNIDKNLLYRGIMNLVSNAVDYTPHGGKMLFEVQSSVDNISFKITDSGRGFSNEDMKSGTNQFYMGDNSRVSKVHYGMGLYITQNIINQHNGSLQIGNSKITGGGEVTIKIPI